MTTSFNKSTLFQSPKIAEHIFFTLDFENFKSILVYLSSHILNIRIGKLFS
jgi:hypothetical protein